MTYVLSIDHGDISHAMNPYNRATAVGQSIFRRAEFQRTIMQRRGAVKREVIMASTKKNTKKQDEKHLKLLRDLCSLAHNKKCFDCGQRGPTYVNMTIGSFVCTSCSGIL